MASKIEIALEQANGELVNLDAMSAEALSSFMAVVSSFKSIVENQVDDNYVYYGIKKGSASLVAQSNNNSIDLVYKNLSNTIKEGSRDKILTSNLKSIQGYFKNQDLEFRFLYTKNGSSPIDLKENFVKSKIIQKRTRDKISYKLEVKSGLLNQIGGNKPNYHLDQGINNKHTISCSKEDAQEINHFLYKNIKVLVISKTHNRKDKLDSYTHKAILNNTTSSIFTNFLRKYNQIEDLIEKLDYLYDYTFNLEKNKEALLPFLKLLIIGFNSKEFHPSELKTVLVITKSFKLDADINSTRTHLLDTLNSIVKDHR